MYHLIIDFFEQTSMSVLLSLGFVFGCSFLLLLFINRGFRSAKWNFPFYLVSFIRSLFITLLFCAILGSSLVDFSINKNDTILVLIDNSLSMRAADSLHGKNEIQNIIKSIQSKHKGYKILLFSLSGKVLNENNIDFSEVKSSVQKVSKIIHNISKNHSISSIYLTSDAQLDDLETVLNTHYNFIFIPFGKSSTNIELELEVPLNTIITVPNEEISIPISVSIGQSNRQCEMKMEVYLDDQLFSRKILKMEPKEPYQNLNFPVKSNKLGKHSLLVKVFYQSAIKSKNLHWKVVKEKAIINAFALAPHPDMGVLNRVAKEMHITMNWNFDSPPKDKINNVLIYGDIKNMVNYLPDDAILLINTKGLKSNLNYQQNNFELWNLQMKEKLTFGNSFQLDSIVKTWFTQAFLNKKNNENVFYFEKNEIKENEDLVFYVERGLSENNLIQLDLIDDSIAKNSKSFNYSLTTKLNQFSIKGLKPGKYQAFVKIKQVNQLVKIDQVLVNKHSPESSIGRNSIQINRMNLSKNIEIVESDHILKSPNKRAFSNDFIQNKNAYKALYEFFYFSYLMLFLLFLEWFLRKKLDLL